MRRDGDGSSSCDEMVRYRLRLMKAVDERATAEQKEKKRALLGSEALFMLQQEKSQAAARS